MIDKDELLELAKSKGLAPRAAELDYFQDIALLYTYKEFGNALAFKGGTCLYKVYQLNRFSEDLDFTARKGFRPRDFFHRLPYLFSLLNIKSVVDVQQFETATNVYLEIQGPLYDGRKESRATLIFNISLRERVLLPIQRHPYNPVYKEIRSFDIFAMDENEILAEKARAIYGRNKARDVYDFWYLVKLKGLAFDAAFANKKLAYDKIKFEKGGFLAKIKEKKTSWERDLGGLIPGELPPFDKVVEELETALGAG
jgi:predicted nucleotidyltransferase component of viral defense system